MSEKITLTVCVIGRNEADNISPLVSSLVPLEHPDITIKHIFVDSGSNDDSVRMAENLFDVVICLPENDRLCSSLGRYWGTLQAESGWILYLDGDMRLQSEFAECLIDYLLNKNDTDSEGFLGRYINVYPDGTVRNDVLGSRIREGTATHFGGAVLLRADAVQKVKNWNPYIYSNEEIELYTRLRGAGYKITYVDVPMITHHTEKVSGIQQILNNLSPKTSTLGKKFYGIGQLFMCKIKGRRFLELIRYFHYPFVFWGFIMLAIPFFIAGWFIQAFLVILLGASYVWVTKGHQFIILYLLLPIQVMFGFNKYQDNNIIQPVKILKNNKLIADN